MKQEKKRKRKRKEKKRKEKKKKRKTYERSYSTLPEKRKRKEKEKNKKKINGNIGNYRCQKSISCRVGSVRLHACIDDDNGPGRAGSARQWAGTA